MQSPFAYSRVPIFLISYNRLTYLRQLVSWLEDAGHENIHIVDNASTYEPLVDYLSSSPHTVHRLEKNFGHLAVWNCGRFKKILDNEFYAVSDCDILPVSECPKDVMRHFHDTLSSFNEYTKVGFSLKIDDLPDAYLLKEKVIEWEKQFWQPAVGPGLIDANIDTTFALYKPGIEPSNSRWWKSIRTSFPYTARHLPWYEDSMNPSPEELYYQRTLDGTVSWWSVTDARILKEQNTAYAARISALNSELENQNKIYWKIPKSPQRLVKGIARRVMRFLLRK